jgi:3-oxoacyl-[acyl-carrier-protein] synthase III
MRRCRLESLGVSLPRRVMRRGSVAHAVAAGRDCLARSQYRAADVSVIINAGVHRDGHICEPAMAAYIQHRLGVNIDFRGPRTLAFDLQNGACGMLNAVHVLSALLLCGEVQVGMVVASEANCDRRPDPNSNLPRSGAALLLDLSPQREVGFGAFAFHTREAEAERVTSVVRLTTKRGRLLRRSDPAAEELFLDMAGAVVEDVLAREGLTRADLDLVVPAQLSPSRRTRS